MIKLNVNSLIFHGYIKEVSAKLEENHFKDAVHLVCSENVFIESSEDTFKVLESMYPSSYIQLCSCLNDPPLNDCSYLRVSIPVI